MLRLFLTPIPPVKSTSRMASTLTTIPRTQSMHPRPSVMESSSALAQAETPQPTFSAPTQPPLSAGVARFNHSPTSPFSVVAHRVNSPVSTSSLFQRAMSTNTKPLLLLNEEKIIALIDNLKLQALFDHANYINRMTNDQMNAIAMSLPSILKLQEEMREIIDTDVCLSDALKLKLNPIIRMGMSCQQLDMIRISYRTASVEFIYLAHCMRLCEILLGEHLDTLSPDIAQQMYADIQSLTQQNSITFKQTESNVCARDSTTCETSAITFPRSFGWNF